MLGEPALLARHDRGDAQRKAFLAEQRVAAVAAAERPDRLFFGKMDDVLLFLVARPRDVFLARRERHADRVHAGHEVAVAPSTSSTLRPMRVMMRMLTTTYGESVSSTPMWAMCEPSGPMLNGITYMVRPRMQPSNSLLRVAFISSGATQLLLGPASSLVLLHTKVRSSIRATSSGSERARKQLGRFCGVQLDQRAGWRPSRRTGGRIPPASRRTNRSGRAW